MAALDDKRQDGLVSDANTMVEKPEVAWEALLQPSSAYAAIR